MILTSLWKENGGTDDTRSPLFFLLWKKLGEQEILEKIIYYN